MKKRYHNLAGASGEYFVAAEILRRRGIATLAPKNTPGIDILASSIDGKKFASIQVKTKGAGEDWPMGTKPLQDGKHLFYRSKYSCF